MKGYFECGKCAHQWMLGGSSMNNRCQSCGHRGGRCEIGSMSQPDWYRGADHEPSKREASFQKFNRVMLVGVAIGVGLFALGCCFLLVATAMRMMP